MGAEVLELPAIRTAPLADPERTSKSIAELYNISGSHLQVPRSKVFFEEMKKSGTDVRKLGQAKVAAIGEGTKKALEERGIFCGSDA